MTLKIKILLILLASFLSLSVLLPSSASAFASSKDCQSTNTPVEFQNCVKNNRIIKDLQNIVNFLSGLALIVIIGAIIAGGIQYSLAGGSPESVSKAKQRIMNAAIAFGVFLFIFAFLQWIIPGGIFG